MVSKGDSDFYRRELAIIERASYNPKVNRLFTECYNLIKSLNNIDSSIFIDTYLRLTTSFKSGDFTAEFKRVFFNTLREKKLCLIEYNSTHQSLSNAYNIEAEEA